LAPLDALQESIRVPSTSPMLQTELEQQVKNRTGRRIRNLAVELDSEQITLRGQASSYYIKQLATHSVHGLLPHIRLENAIVVVSQAEGQLFQSES
jgi:hypothetical protein